MPLFLSSSSSHSPSVFFFNSEIWQSLHVSVLSSVCPRSRTPSSVSLAPFPYLDPLDSLSRCLLSFHSDLTSPLAPVTPCHCRSPLLSHAWLAWPERPIHGADLMKCIDRVTRPSLSKRLSDRLQQSHSSTRRRYTCRNCVRDWTIRTTKPLFCLCDDIARSVEKISCNASAAKRGRSSPGTRASRCPCQSQTYLNYHWRRGGYITLCCSVWVAGAALSPVDVSHRYTPGWIYDVPYDAVRKGTLLRNLWCRDDCSPWVKKTSSEQCQTWNNLNI